jgi:heat shock protein HslJ
LIGVTWQGAEPMLTVVFTDHTARIFDGCRNELREVAIGDGVMDVGKLIPPASVCGGHPGPPQPDIDTFDAVVLFGHHLTWHRDGNALLLANNEGRSVELHLAGAALSATDQEWVLQRFNDPRGYSHEGDYTAARLLIAQDGTVNGSDLCNDLTGSATVTDATMTFTGMHTTARGCPGQTSSAVSEVVDQVLLGDVTYALRGNELIIDGNRRGLLVYTPSP